MMTISQFSDRTGLRPKLLRYYEETGLIVPAVRLENGYRQYTESQVESAQLVNSLRQADVSIAGIREFLVAPTNRREQLLEAWRNMASAKLLSVQVANQFLQGFDSRTKRMHLVHWESPKTLVWFLLDTNSPTEGLQTTVKKIYKERINPKQTCERSGYVRYILNERHGETGVINTEVGFLVTGMSQAPDGARLETVPQTLFATMVCAWDMPFSCKPILAMIRRFGFQQVGEPMRKVTFSTEDSYSLMVPVMRH
ncbi:MerR family transcriptional regulator [Cohnella suwonensis]|uniref:MerR family transcriptional regulator n=1 Tax=Cohnella suwonensis TaxID=696072 RepID=A0ABW0LPM4_9BACL